MMVCVYEPMVYLRIRTARSAAELLLKLTFPAVFSTLLSSTGRYGTLVLTAEELSQLCPYVAFDVLLPLYVD